MSDALPPAVHIGAIEPRTESQMQAAQDALDLKVEERRVRVAQLRRDGFTPRQIAQVMELDISIVRTDLRITFAALHAERTQAGQEHLELQVMRSETLYQKAYEKLVNAKTGKDAMMAHRGCVEAMDHEAKLLGLYAAKKITIDHRLLGDAVDRVARIALRHIHDDADRLLFADELERAVADIQPDKDVIDAEYSMGPKS